VGSDWCRLDEEKLPLHVAFIPDGNRRWARRRGLPEWAGHARGYEAAREALNRLWAIGVRYVTFYALSRENCLARPRGELERIYSLLSGAVDELLSDRRVREGRVRLFFAGDFSLLPGWLREKMVQANEATRGNGPDVLTVATCYSGAWEIEEAVRRAAREGCGGGCDARSLLPLGWLPEPDLLVRTGGELRLSGFLLPHLSYTELYFTHTLWPDFGPGELCAALRDYQRRQRRFGR